MSKKLFFFVKFLMLPIGTLSVLTQSSFAVIPNALEPEYSEAILAFHGKNYDRALQILDELLKTSPQIAEFLELKALTLKTVQKPKESAQTYKQLIETKLKDGADAKQIAPYYFELGMIRYQEKKFERCIQYLDEAAKVDFNFAATHFFLGMSHFQMGNYPISNDHFSKVISSNTLELKPASYFYQGQIGFKRQMPAIATQSFFSAISTSETIINDPKSSNDSKAIAKQILDASQKALEPLNKSHWFGNLALSFGYDTNVLASPSSSTTTGSLNSSSVGGFFQAGIGHMSSPLNTIQWIPNYRTSINYYFNRNASSAEFYTNNLSLYMNVKPLSLFSWGLKLEGFLLFQNSGTYARYLHGLTTGPYMKTNLGSSTLGLETFFTFNTYAQDETASSASQLRSGTDIDFRAFLQNDQGQKFWNPTYSVTFTLQNAKGTDYKSKNFSGTLENLIYFSKTLSLNLLASFEMALYSNRTPQTRTDKTFTFQAAVTKKINSKWTLFGNAQYMTNASDLPTLYAFNRFSFLTGANLSLF